MRCHVQPLIDEVPTTNPALLMPLAPPRVPIA
jgi:hypothetical protein